MDFPATSKLLSDPMDQVFAACLLVGSLLVLVFAFTYLRKNTYVKFAYNCFIKPHGKSGSRSQQDALEGFYKAQASIYDSTRMKLLRGREDMLGLVAAQVIQRVGSGALPPKPVWVDIGGGTGYNIEEMARFVDVPNFFEKVYLVDFSPSLCQVAQERFLRLGWKNIKVVCEDARRFHLDEHDDSSGMPPSYSQTILDEKTSERRPHLVTMSYSLSMIPEYYSVIDSLSSLLATNGVIGVADFYVQSEIDYHSRNYIGGEINRHCMWISRVFWRTWFEADRVGLEAARRDYLEYRFGTVLSFNERCHLFGLRIPYYVWIGCSKDAGPTQLKLAQLNAAATESPFLSALDLHSKNVEAEHATAIEVRSKAYDSAVVNLAASLPLPASWYQLHHWRIHYEAQLEKHRQFKDEYIYAFTWEDARVDTRLLKIQQDDVILAITSAGDNILAYALEKPKRIHAVDLNPTQNHLLELKVAAFTALSYADVWKLFGEGVHTNFRELLVTKLSPHMSSLAFQYWLQYGSKTFTGNGFYFTGGSRHAISLARWLFGILGLKSEVNRLCTAQTMNEQREIWQRSIRRVLLSRLLSWTIVSNKQWLWRALGVPSAQREMIEHDYERQQGAEPLSPPASPSASPKISHKREPNSNQLTTASATVKTNHIAQYGSGRAIWNYAVQTLDPVINHTMLSSDNHYYLLCLLGHYTRACHPEYLTPKAHQKLSRPNGFGGLRIHTDEVKEVVERMRRGTLTIAVLMDSLDWFNPHDDTPGAMGRAELTQQVVLVSRAMKMGGRVMIRSAGTKPWYVEVFEDKGFKARRVGSREMGKEVCVDRVNMYASCWIFTKMMEVDGYDGKAGLEPLSIGSPMQED